jgi:hypothetical protein
MIGRALSDREANRVLDRLGGALMAHCQTS